MTGNGPTNDHCGSHDDDNDEDDETTTINVIHGFNWSKSKHRGQACPYGVATMEPLLGTSLLHDPFCGMWSGGHARGPF
jgi:hypothetical protein